MTEHLEPMTPYEARLGRELRTLSDEALRPIDAAAIASTIAATDLRWRGGWTRLVVSHRVLRLALVGLLIVLLAALAVIGVGSRLNPPAPFSGAIAFTRGGNLYIAAGDGTAAVEVASVFAAAATGSLTKVAWSPNHRAVAFMRRSETKAELFIVSPRGDLLGRTATASPSIRTLNRATWSSSRSTHAVWAPSRCPLDSRLRWPMLLTSSRGRLTGGGSSWRAATRRPVATSP
jgi:hypothetical protein